MKRNAAKTIESVTRRPNASNLRGKEGASRQPRPYGIELADRVVSTGASRLAIQAKLTVSEPSDPLEQEADRIAARVVQGARPSPIGLAPTGALQRACDTCAKEEDAHLFAGATIHPHASQAIAGQTEEDSPFVQGVAFRKAEYAAQRAAAPAGPAQPKDSGVPTAGPTGSDPAGTTCGKDHEGAIGAAAGTASSWLGSVNTFFDAHLNRIKKRAPGERDYRSIGETLFRELSLLDKHFKYSDIVVKEWRSRFPDSANWEGSFKEFETLGRASYFIRRNFMRVSVSDLPHKCVAPCPRGKAGADWVGSAIPGSKEYTIYTNCFDKQNPNAKAATVLHEAFHASFDDFTGDSYSKAGDYPGASPVSNADSYATFASVVATGESYRVIVVDEVKIGPDTPSAPAPAP